MSEFNPAENQAQIAKLFNQSEDLIKRSKKLNEEFGTSSKDVATLQQQSEELIFQTRQLLENIKRIKSKNS